MFIPATQLGMTVTVLAAWLPAVLQAGVSEFSSRREALAYANEAIEDADRPLGALVVTVDTVAEEPIPVGVKIWRYAGYVPTSLDSDHYGVFLVRPAREMALEIRIDGYHVWKEAVVVRADEIVELVVTPDPVTDRSAGRIIGQLKLEDRDDVEGITVRLASSDQETTTDAYGRFRFENVGGGEQSVHARVEGFHRISARVRVERGGIRAVQLLGFRPRSAMIRWAYQPEAKSRDLAYGLETGVALVAPGLLDRISFAEGFTQVPGKSDLFIAQERDKLIMRHFDDRGDGPGNIAVPGTAFREIQQAPNIKYPDTRRILEPDDVYIFRCYDGDHFAKIEVLEVHDRVQERETALAEIARQPLE